MPKITTNIAIIIIFIAATLIMTYPISFEMKTHIAGFCNTDEPYGIIWRLWWFKYSRQHGLNYKDCEVLAFPFGFKLGRPVASSYLWEGVKNFLSMATNEIAAYNILILSGFLLTLIFGYLLIFYITSSTPVSIFSAFVFAFCPYHFARAWQHLSLSQIQWIPLYMLALFKSKDSPKKIIVLLSALAFFLIASFNLYYAYFLLIVTACFLIYFTAYYKSVSLGLRLMKRFIVSLIIAGILFAPSLFDLYKESKVQRDTPVNYSIFQRSFDNLFTQSAKPLSYLLPAISHPIFGKFTERFIGSPLYGVSYTEHTLYLGWTPLLLAFVAFKRWRKARKMPQCPSAPVSQLSEKENFYISFFIVLAIVAWLFSQPPYFRFPHFKIYMPSFVMYKILPMFRAYTRFGIVLMLAVAVLAGYGLRFILERFKSRKAKIAFTSLVCGLVLFEFLNFPPFKTIDLTTYPKVYDWLKAQKGDFAVGEYPLDVKGVNEYYKFCQTIHHKKIINGTSPGTYANKIAQAIWRLSTPPSAQALSWMKVKYVLVHLDAYESSNEAQVLEELDRIKTRSLPGLTFVKGFDDIDVYEVTATPKKPNINE